MSDFDTQLLSTLDRIHLPVTTGADWDDVLARVERLRQERAASTGRRSAQSGRWLSRRRLGMVAVAAVAAVVASLVATAPWKGGPSFTARALAAIGSARYIVATVEPAIPSATDVDLATGKEKRVRVTTTYWLDSKRPENESRIYFNGVPGSSLTAGPDPAMAAFATGYQAALSRGDARTVGETMVEGRKARIIRFTITTLYLDGNKIQFPGGEPTMWEDVAVDETTYKPLWFREGGLTQRSSSSEGPKRKVVAIHAVVSPPRIPKDVPFYDGSVTTVRKLSTAGAAGAFGREPVWPGRRAANLPLRSALLQRVTTSVYPVVYPPVRTGTGLRFIYRQGRSRVEVNESVKPFGGYGFASPTRTSDLGAIPSEGTMRVSRFSGTFTAQSTPFHRGTVFAPWAGQLRSNGLYITIRATSRSLLIKAARALTVMH